MVPKDLQDWATLILVVLAANVAINTIARRVPAVANILGGF